MTNIRWAENNSSALERKGPKMFRGGRHTCTTIQFSHYRKSNLKQNFHNFWGSLGLNLIEL